MPVRGSPDGDRARPVGERESPSLTFFRRQANRKGERTRPSPCAGAARAPAVRESTAERPATRNAWNPSDTLARDARLPLAEGVGRISVPFARTRKAQSIHGIPKRKRRRPFRAWDSAKRSASTSDARYIKELSLSLLTVKMLLLGSDHLLRGGLADGLGEALAGDTVPRSQQPVVDRLSRHTVPLSQWLSGSQQQFTFTTKSRILPRQYPPGAIESFHPHPHCRAPVERTTSGRMTALGRGRERRRWRDEVIPTGREERREVDRPWRNAGGRERDYEVRALRLTSPRTTTRSRSRPRHGTKHDSQDRALPREASATSRSPRYYTWPAALLFRSSGTSPRSRPPPPPSPPPLLVRRHRLLSRFLRSRRANDSPPRFLRVHQQRSQTARAQL